MRTETFHTPGEVLLRVRVPVGRVDIETIDGEETRVELESEPEVEESAILEASGGEVVVEVEERSLLFIRSAPDARVRVTCPHGVRIEYRGVSAAFSVRGRTGAVDANTVSGDVEMERVDGDLEIKSVSGNVTVDGVTGRTRIRAVSGDLRVGEAADAVTGQTVSGDQRIGSVAEGSVTLKSVSGDLHIGIRRGTRLWMDVKSLSGETSSEFELDDAPPDGVGPLVELRANATSGDIRIVRAPS